MGIGDTALKELTHNIERLPKNSEVRVTCNARLERLTALLGERDYAQAAALYKATYKLVQDALA